MTTTTLTPELLDQLLAGYEKPEDLTGDDGLFRRLGAVRCNNEQAKLNRAAAINVSQNNSSQTSCHVRVVPIVLQNSKNGLQRFSREKSNHATIADRCVLKRTTEVAGESIASC
jgi:hypothetical protein